MSCSFPPFAWSLPAFCYFSFPVRTPLTPYSILRTHFQVPYRVSPVFATLTKTPGVWGYSSHFGTSSLRLPRPCREACRPRSRGPAMLRFLCFHIVAHSFALSCTLLYSAKTQLFSFQLFPHSSSKNGVWGQGAIRILELFVLFLTSLPHYLDAAKLGGTNHLGATHV